ncbi:mRNA-capping enzyme subunit beta [Marasmius crinis-equi]|uniref:mRNA-capping enzyme subunit beta n=1 Tax=Marasmius crinis-equi TaxID=585013 RepID=A0ABR3FPC6_9AGAR
MDSTEGPPHKRPRHENGQLPPLSLSILGVEPLDEFIKEIADFVHHMIVTNRVTELPPGAVVEVEAKVGLLKDKMSGQRLGLPVLVETILQPDSIECRFESNMTARQHKHFNGLLNKLKTSSDEPGYASTPLRYAHLYLIDMFYEGGSREKIRVTKEEKTGNVVESIKKPAGQPSRTRRKDRLSYTHEEFSVDLTQVTATQGSGSPAEVLHELELEIARPELLLYTASKRGDPNASEHERSAFDELIRAFVNNARILVRNAIEEWH